MVVLHSYSSGSGESRDGSGFDISSGSGGPYEDELSSINVCGGSASVERGVVTNYSAENWVFSFTTERDALEVAAKGNQYVQVDSECEDKPYV